MQDESIVDDETAAKGKRKGKEAKAKEGKKSKTAPEPADDETNLARLLIRAVWTHDWTAANPEKSVTERAAAWKEQRQAVNEAELKKTRKVLISLKRLGVTMSAPEKVGKSDAQGDESSDD